ncbi:hypothetical protein ACFQ5M_01390 [Agrilactobacillus yilanensis]|uniref:Carbohydrate-binding protein n=1 Tax=Agrilactobacillus yilanensis TaxID=2485997 RepID=A0ABW4J3G8_9LACO|nr:hypothetical protein [Agrilactobacillus yilanensis]
MLITLQLLNRQGQVKSGSFFSNRPTIDYKVTGNNLVTLGIDNMVWQAGDFISIKIEKPNQYLWVQLDETLAPSLIYLKTTEWIYKIPFSNKERSGQVDTAFCSKRHYLVARKAMPEDIDRYQNLALNTHDQSEVNGAYPHVSANVETRGEAVFFARNVIDGKLANLAHGIYPFQSWGINQQKNAELTLDFGRLVHIDRIKLLFRGDYPHDSFWTAVTITFSDNSKLRLTTVKSLDFQTFDFPVKNIIWLKLGNLQKNNDVSVFPALSQIEVYGQNSIR